jgi:hypothetical protein
MKEGNMPPTQKQTGAGSTAPDDKSDARHPDTVADKRTDSPAHPTDLDVNETNEDVNKRYGFSTIDTSDVDHSKAEIKPPEQVDQESGSSGAQILDNGAHRNSTFAERNKARSERTNARASGIVSK